MQLSKIKYFLLVAVLMLVAKPFVGFNMMKQFRVHPTPSIVVKAFTKRKQEYVEDSTFDVISVQKKLANPLLVFTALFAFLLNALLPICRKANKVTAGLLADIHAALFPPLPRYLLAGQLII